MPYAQRYSPKKPTRSRKSVGREPYITTEPTLVVETDDGSKTTREDAAPSG